MMPSVMGDARCLTDSRRPGAGSSSRGRASPDVLCEQALKDIRGEPT
jgi:hypothetical protein